MPFCFSTYNMRPIYQIQLCILEVFWILGMMGSPTFSRDRKVYRFLDRLEPLAWLELVFRIWPTFLLGICTSMSRSTWIPNRCDARIPYTRSIRWRWILSWMVPSSAICCHTIYTRPCLMGSISRSLMGLLPSYTSYRPWGVLYTSWRS